MPAYSLKVDPKSKLHKKLLSRIQSRWGMAKRGRTDREAVWARAEEIVLAYVPETVADGKRRSKREAGDPRYTTIMIPYTYALLMAAHTYWTSVFFARSPVHQFTGRHGEAEMQVQALEALISYQVEIGEMMAPYYVWLYDSGKYGVGILGHYWTTEMIRYGQMVEIDGNLYQTTQEVQGYQGNRAYNISPYDFWHDTRVPISQFQRGEFCFVRKRMGWKDILQRKEDGYFINLDDIKKHRGSDRGNTDGSAQLKRPDFSVDEFSDYDIQKDKTENHPAGAIFLEVYIDLIPDEWGLGQSKLPQKWCITVTEDVGLVVGCSPLGYMHGKFPIDIIEPEVEAYGLFNRGIPEIMEPIQNTMDWLINSHFFNVRTAMNNQFIIDPSKIVIKDVQNSTAGFVWRLRPEAYGSDLSKIFMQIPVQDVTRGHLADFQQMIGIGERTLGINDQIMGALNNGGRKTATEVRTSTGFGVNRLKTTSEFISATGMGPHAQKLVQTSQQYYDQEGKLRIVGDLANAAGPRFMDVTPQSIAGFYDFVPVDGVLPVDRMAQSNLWKEIMMGMASGRMPPEVLQRYDVTKIFAWMASLGGIKNLKQMERVNVQVMPDQALQAQAGKGNVVPMPNRGVATPGNSASTGAGLNALMPQE